MHDTLYIQPHKRPKVLLLGNGLNRVYGGASWAGLLEKINRTPYRPQDIKGIPFPMQAVLLSRDHVGSSLQELKEELTQCDIHPWLDGIIDRLLSLPFDCILTPNFTYEIECAAVPDFLTKNRWKKYQRHTAAVKKSEQKFMLHTYYDLPLGERTVPLFHIHGEARKPNSVILGHYYYGSLLFRYDQYLTRRAPGEKYRTGKHPEGLPVLSWLDYFILGDVYCLGFGFDPSEMDMWWLLCRKKYEQAAHGSLYFLEPDRRSAETKIALLKAYHARHVSFGVREPKTTEDYRGFYETAVEALEAHIKLKEGMPL
ncbi:MAG: hypothetical protein IJO69_05825 [Ruminiclostridium sp.]|nr:hypothetical protein [Ruminiclostridium sp.]